MEEKYFAHPTAVIDEGCSIGSGCKIWHFSHIMEGAVLGEGCNIGQNVVISPGVTLGRNCKVQNNVSVYTGVICADDVLCEGAIEWENERNKEGSSEVKIASFHDSLAFSCSSPKVSAIDVDAYTLGKTASELLLSCLCGKEVESRNYVDYNFLFR